jgi:hypothetical protein
MEQACTVTITLLKTLPHACSPAVYADFLGRADALEAAHVRAERLRDHD